MPGPMDTEAMSTMIAGAGVTPTDPRGMYQQWQSAIAELERMKAGGPPETVAPEYRVNPNTNEREYNIGGKWAREKVYQDPQFQATVVEPWVEKERMRRAEEYQKQLAEMQQRAAMHEYDYNDFMRRQEELKGNGVGKSTFGRPSAGGGGGSMGSTTRRY